MVAETPTLLYCPRCKDRGVRTPLLRKAPTSLEYRHGESHHIIVIWGMAVVTCERDIGRRGSGMKCGYEVVIDQRA